MHGNFQGTSYLKIDEDLPATDPALGSATFPGWYSVLRHGWNTPEETAVWLTGGEDYRDHRHLDNGSVVVYALGAPLSVDWGPIYYPHVSGGFLHSLVLPEAEIGHPWDRGDVPLNAGKCWLAGKPEPLQRDVHSTGAVHHFRLGSDLEWSRSVRLIHAIPELPIIAIRDEFSGTRAAVPKILTFNVMAAGPVATPAGPMTPPERTHARESFTPGKAEDELPSAGKVFDLPPGVARLGFSGQTWKAYPTGGIDFDVYLASDAATQAHIGNWAHLWHPSPEEGQFRGANEAQRFEERQHILRVRGTTAFTTLLIPWNKGRRPTGWSVSADGDSLVVRTAHQMIRINKSTLACDVVRH